MKPAGCLAERGAQLGPGAHEAVAHVAGPLAERLGSLPHLTRGLTGGLGGAHPCLIEGAFGFTRLPPSGLARLIELGFRRLLEARGAVLHLLEARLEARHHMAAERRGMNL